MAWSPLVELVSLEQAKTHLKLPLDPTDQDDDLQLKLYIAHEIVLDYVSQRIDDTDDAWALTVDGWSAGTAPKRVLGAILEQFALLYRARGDDEFPVNPHDIAPGAASLLKRLRDPAVS